MIHYYGWRTGSRHVVVLGPLTFKFPKLWVSRFFKALFGKGSMDYSFGWFTWRLSVSMSFRGNFTEAKWAFREKPSYIVPCLIPLGIVNVYPTVQGVGVPRVSEYLFHAYKTSGRNEWPAGFSQEFRKAFQTGPVSHHLESDENYAMHGGEIKLLDYGAEGVIELTTNHPDEF